MKAPNNFEEKLAKLREEYQAKLPDKISEITDVWTSLSKEANAESLALFHRRIHSLHGSADTFGYSQLGKIAARLEILANSMLNDPALVKENNENVNAFLEELTTLASAEDVQPQIVPSLTENADTARIIYFLDNDKNWENNFTSQMIAFGYQIQAVSSPELLIEKLNKQHPAILLINITLVTTQLQDVLIALTKKLEIAKVPLIVTSTSGEFSLRLKAVRLGAVAFFIKPFLIDDLIQKIDSLVKEEVELSRILIIDDEIDVASYNATILEQANMKTSIITKASEIDHGLHTFDPDLILIDINMPDCNGLELAAIIRQQSIFQSIPIIYLSSEGDQLKQLEAMKLGADDFLNKATKPDFLIMTIRNRIARYKKLCSFALRDDLTGLYNHSFVLKQLAIELKESMQLHNPLSVAIIELDKFKAINDTYGHQAGDHVFRSLGLMISKRLHTNDIVGRYANAKFIVILPNTTQESAISIIEELRKQFLTLNYSWNQQIFNASFSAGIASFPTFHTAADLLEAADQSVDKSKKSGKNRVETAT